MYKEKREKNLWLPKAWPNIGFSPKGLKMLSSMILYKDKNALIFVGKLWAMKLQS